MMTAIRPQLNTVLSVISMSYVHSKGVSQKFSVFLVLLVSFVLAAGLSSCSYDDIKDTLIPEKESQFAKDYLEKLRLKDFEYIKTHAHKDLLAEIDDNKLNEVASVFRSGQPISTSIIGSQVNVFNDTWQGNFTFEYEFEEGWGLANAVLKKEDSEPKVIGFNVYQTAASQEEINRFTFQGKSILHYTVLVLVVVIPLFIIATTVICFRTPIPKRKWLWVLFVAIGIGTINLNWTTGEYELQFLAFQLLGSGAVAMGPYSPWIISAAIPIGAIVFWAKRQSFIRASSVHEE